MTANRWISETVPALGAAKAEGMRRQLGRPRFDRLTVLVRESAQNSWDARISDDTQVRFSMDFRTLDDELRNAWLGTLRQESHMAGTDIEGALSEPAPVILFISDRGTKGLEGPTRATRLSRSLATTSRSS